MECGTNKRYVALIKESAHIEFPVRPLNIGLLDVILD